MDKFTKGYALIIAIANYQNVRKLPESVLNDGKDIFAHLASPSCGYSSNQVRFLLDEQANKANIHKGFEWLASKATPEDTVLVYFSGHGGQKQTHGVTRRYLITHDSTLEDLSNTAMSEKSLNDLISKIHSKKIALFFDCCYSGGLGNFKGNSDEPLIQSLDMNYYDQLAQGTGGVIIASSRPEEVSLVFPDMDNSLFTKLLLEALKGKARVKNGVIGILDVFNYISDEISAYGLQHPVLKASNLENNFPLALYQASLTSETRPENKIPPDTVELRKIINKNFNMEEIALLCEDIQGQLNKQGVSIEVSLDAVGGQMKEYKIMELIKYLANRGYLQNLMEAVRNNRPGVF